MVLTSGRGTKGCSRQKSHVFSASGATMTSRRANMSSTVRVWGTTVSHVGNSGQLPRIDMTPRDGVYATRPLLEAGERPEEIVSSPTPKTPKLAAVAVADPLEEPDAKAAVRYSALYGDSARPYTPRCIPPAA